MFFLTVSFLSYKIITRLKRFHDFKDTIQIEPRSEDTPLANATNHSYEWFFDAQEEVIEQNEYECFFDAQEELIEQNKCIMIFFDAQAYSDAQNDDNDHCTECFFDAQEQADNDDNDSVHSQDTMHFYDAQEYSDAHDDENDHCNECFFDAQEREGYEKPDGHQFSEHLIDTQEGWREITFTHDDLSSDTSEGPEEHVRLADDFSDSCPQLIDEGKELEQRHRNSQCSSTLNLRRNTKLSIVITVQCASIDKTNTVRDQYLNHIIKGANDDLCPSKKTSRHTIQIKHAELGLHRYQDERGRLRIRSRRARTTSPR